MKLQDLREYRKTPLGAQFSKETLSNFLVDEDAIELLRTHISIPNEKDLVVAKYTFDSDHAVFILFNRTDTKDIAGYLFIKKFDQYWQVMETSLFAPYRNKGLGTDLYVRAIRHGYSLMNGFSLSADAEKMWKERLPKAVTVRVFDKETGRISKFSDLPTNDTGTDNQQRYFYVAEHHGLDGALLENYSVNDGLGNLKYENWLLNKNVLPFHGYRTSRFGNENDF